jgi:hypothetical protein
LTGLGRYVTDVANRYSGANSETFQVAYSTKEENSDDHPDEFRFYLPMEMGSRRGDIVPGWSRKGQCSGLCRRFAKHDRDGDMDGSMVPGV